MNIIPSSVKDERLKRVSYLFSAFTEIMTILRDHRIDDISDDVIRLYSTISGNTFLQGQMYNYESKLISKFKPEMKNFVIGRIASVVEAMVNRIANSSLINATLSTNGTMVNTSSLSYVNYSRMNMQALRLAEFDITRDNLGPTGLNEHDCLSETQVPDTIGTFINLIKSTSTLINRCKRTSNTSDVTKTTTDFNDHSAVDKLITIGYLIGVTGRALMIAKSGDDHDYTDDKNEFVRDLIYDDYTRLSNLGAISIPGIICCFKNEMLMKVAVSNGASELGSVERRLLINTLALSKLTSVQCEY